MRFRLYHVATGQPYGPARPAPYSVDGKPGVLPPDLVEVEIAEEKRPTPPEGNTVKRVESLDLSEKKLRLQWQIVPVEIEPPEKSETELLAERVAALELEIQKLKEGTK